MIKGKYVALRAIEESDLKQLLVWRNNPSFRRYFREYRELNYCQQLDWFDKKVNNDSCTKMFSIVDVESNYLLGACGLCYIDWVNRTADFSIYIGHEDIYIDTTYAHDAAKLLINYAYGELALNRLWSEIYSFDSQKNEFFQKLGFTLEGVHRQTHWADSQWVDSMFFGLVKADLDKST
jgi:RimJ/RimL family protein N-acetyltransferase